MPKQKSGKRNRRAAEVDRTQPYSNRRGNLQPSAFNQGQYQAHGHLDPEDYNGNTRPSLGQAPINFNDPQNATGVPYHDPNVPLTLQNPYPDRSNFDPRFGNFTYNINSNNAQYGNNNSFQMPQWQRELQAFAVHADAVVSRSMSLPPDPERVKHLYQNRGRQPGYMSYNGVPGQHLPRAYGPNMPQGNDIHDQRRTAEHPVAEHQAPSYPISEAFRVDPNDESTLQPRQVTARRVHDTNPGLGDSSASQNATFPAPGTEHASSAPLHDQDMVFQLTAPMLKVARRMTDEEFRNVKSGNLMIFDEVSQAIGQHAEYDESRGGFAPHFSASKQGVLCFKTRPRIIDEVWPEKKQWTTRGLATYENTGIAKLSAASRTHHDQIRYENVPFKNELGGEPLKMIIYKGHESFPSQNSLVDYSDVLRHSATDKDTGREIGELEPESLDRFKWRCFEVSRPNEAELVAYINRIHGRPIHKGLTATEFKELGLIKAPFGSARFEQAGLPSTVDTKLNSTQASSGPPRSEQAGLPSTVANKLDSTQAVRQPLQPKQSGLTSAFHNSMGLSGAARQTVPPKQTSLTTAFNKGPSLSQAVGKSKHEDRPLANTASVVKEQKEEDKAPQGVKRKPESGNEVGRPRKRANPGTSVSPRLSDEELPRPEAKDSDEKDLSDHDALP